MIAEGAAYARSGGARIDVIGLDADGLAPRLGADGCASVDGTDGTGGSCVLVPRNVPIDRIAIAGAHLVISGTVGDAVACGGLCTELLLLDRAPVTGALSVGPLRCVGRGPAYLVPRVPTGPYASIGATPDGRSLVLAGNGAANVFRVAPDGNLTQDAGVDGCIAISGRGGCLRATQFLGRAVAAGDDVLAFAGGTLTLFDRDATTGALTARTGVDACLGPEAPCHVVGTIADTRPLLLPDGHGAAVVEQLGLVAPSRSPPPSARRRRPRR